MLLEKIPKVNIKNYIILKLANDKLDEAQDNLLIKIHQREIDGIVISDFLSKLEIKSIKENIKSIPEESKFEIHGCGGFLYPITFNQLRKDDNYQEHKYRYFKEADIFSSKFSQNFKFNIELKLSNLFSKLSLNKKVIVAPGICSGSKMLPVTIRVFQPGRGGAFPHCHNTYDEDLHPEFVNHFSGLMKMKHQLSFFISVNKPEKGGELTLLNIEHRDANRKQSDFDILKSDGSVFDTTIEENKNKIQLDEGDLIIFAGGDIWHQVEDIEGAKNRVTIGGFGTFSLDNSIFYIWS